MSDELNQESSGEYTPGTEAGHCCTNSVFIPLALLALSFNVLLFWQVINYHTQRGQLETVLKNQTAAVTQAQQVQAGVTKLMTDLVKVAQTDDTAKAIVNAYAKYFRSNAPSAPAASPAAQ